MRIKYTLLLFSVFLSSVLFAKKDPPAGSGEGNQIMERRLATFSELPQIISNRTSNTIDLYFVSEVGVVNIVIKNQRQQIVYKQSVDTSLSTTLQLDLQHLPGGDYDLIISNQRRFVLMTEKFLID